MRLMDSDDDKAEPSGHLGSVRPLSTIRRFKDSVHDYMPFGPEVCAIIDTPQFQRLRHIKQLGTSYYVWPGASHNRFEHSLGVAFLSNLMAEHLQQSQRELGITLRDIKCVTIAGLCHDLGHGPWSHVWDGQFIPRALPGNKWKHEDASDMMFDTLVRENDLELPEDDVAFVKALIAGDRTKCKDTEKPFLFDIVANKRNGLDVDKFDYIARDTHAIDQNVNLSLTRLIHSARVIENEICYDIKDANQIYELCYTRFSLHKRIYNHKTAKAIEYMIVDALLSADKHMHFAKDISNARRFLYLTDDIMTRIEATEQPELEEARAIFHRVHRRDLYRCVDYKVFPWAEQAMCQSYFTPEAIVDAAKGDPDGGADPALLAELEPGDVIVDITKMHYGMGDKNPLESVKFYSKQHPNTCEKAKKEDISLLMPEVFGEVLLRVYTRDDRFFGIIQAGYNTLLKALGGGPSEDPLQSPPRSPTPPVFPAPSTPPRKTRPLSRVHSAGARLLSLGTTPTPNTFMAVTKDFQGRAASPTRRKSGKRERDAEKGESPPKKKAKPAPPPTDDDLEF